MVSVTIGSNTYDSFVSVEDASKYLAADISRATGWAAASTDNQKRGVVSATRMLLGLTWCEEAPDPTEVQPSPIPEVTAQLAADLVAKPKLFSDASGSSNIKAVGAGSAKVEFFSPVSGGPPIPMALWNTLLAAGLVCLGTDSVSVNDGPWFSGVSGCRPYEGRPSWEWPITVEDYD